MSKTRRYNKKRNNKTKKFDRNLPNPYNNMDSKTLDDVLPILVRKKNSMVQDLIKTPKKVKSLFKHYVTEDDNDIQKFVFTNKKSKKLSTIGSKGSVHTYTLSDGNKLVFKISYEKLKFILKIIKNKKYIRYSQKILDCYEPLYVDFLIGSSEFINETIIGFFLDHFISSSEIIHTNAYVKQYDAFIVKKKSCNVMEIADKGDLSDFYTSFPNYVFNNMIQEKVGINMFIQIFSLLHFLQTNFNYTHNDLKVDNIFVSSQPFSGIYQDTTLPPAPFTVKLADYGKNAFTVNKVRYFTVHTGVKGFASKVYTNMHNTKLFKIESGKYEDLYYFCLPQSITAQELGVYLLTRHSGLPYMAELDVYSLLISIYLTPGFHMLFQNSPFFIDFWNNLWINEEEVVRVTNICNKFFRKQTKHNMRDIYNMMAKYQFKLICGMSNQIWDTLKSLIQNPEFNLELI